jgi:hypothetical protein
VVETKTNTTMKKPFTFKQDIDDNCCSNCGKKLNPKKTIWLEYSITDGCVYHSEEFPQGHDSQGCFEFGTDCAKKVVTRNEQQANETPSIDWAKFYKSTTKEQMFNMVYQYAMLMTDEDELKAFEFLKEEKKR